MAYNIEEDPANIKEDLSSLDADLSQEAINDEMDFLESNKTWHLGSKKAAPKLKRRSLDPEEIYTSLHTWPHPRAGVKGNDDDKESVSGNWNSRSMNRDENLITDESVTGQSEVESKQSYSPLLSPTYLLDPSKISVEVATTFTNDSDELELTTSECSEPDMNWQSHLPKTTAISNALASRPNKSTHHKQAKNLETRSMISSSTRKQPNLVSQSRKHSGSIDAKRRSGNAK
ncbi:kinesin-like protein KIN-14G [Cicer arietinum]|uniref:kinesin-like protein KIN-14G n=1 Tax=Cicer arietinum TaxID=3827 RepID=UPI003CC55F54